MELRGSLHSVHLKSLARFACSPIIATRLKQTQEMFVLNVDRNYNG